MSKQLSEAATKLKVPDLRTKQCLARYSRQLFQPTNHKLRMKKAQSLMFCNKQKKRTALVRDCISRSFRLNFTEPRNLTSQIMTKIIKEDIQKRQRISTELIGTFKTQFRNSISNSGIFQGHRKQPIKKRQANIKTRKCWQTRQFCERSKRIETKTDFSDNQLSQHSIRTSKLLVNHDLAFRRPMIKPFWKFNVSKEKRIVENSQENNTSQSQTQIGCGQEFQQGYYDLSQWEMNRTFIDSQIDILN